MISIPLLLVLVAFQTGDAPLPANYAIPTIDLSGDTSRQTVVDREPGQYLGHPTTVLLEDDQTLLTVYPKGHGKGAIQYQRSTDRGRTWSGRLPTPASWATSKETPTIHRTVDKSGKKRLIVWSGLYPARLAHSEDDGVTWSELAPAGDWGGIVVMGFVEPIRGKPGAYLAMFHDDGRFFAAKPQRKSPVEFTLYKTFSEDGGLTWSRPEPVVRRSDIHPCEPGCIRSPDGKQLAVLLRENSRRRNSYVIFSDDEGVTWSEPRELPAALTGDRHTGKYAPDGRLLISFRDTTRDSPTKGDWVAWVGRYEDIVHGKQGQYRVRLIDNHRSADCAYPGVEAASDGEFLLTTYGHWRRGQSPYVVTVRLRLEELDAIVAADTARLGWTDGPPIPDRLGLGGPFAGSAPGALLLAGGANFPQGPPWEDGSKVWYDVVYALPDGAQQWVKCPTRLEHPLAYGASVEVADGVLWIGGSNDQRVVADVRRIAWNADRRDIEVQRLPDLPEPSTYLSACRLGTDVYVLAGRKSLAADREPNRFWRLDLLADPQKMAWQELAPLPGPCRTKTVMAAQTGPAGAPRVFVFSGEIASRDGDETVLRYPNDGYAFDPNAGRSGVWRAIADPPRPVAAASATPVGVRSVLVFGGSTGEHVGKLPIERHPPFPNIVLRYDTAADRWTEVAESPLGVVTTAIASRTTGGVILSGETRPGIRTPRVQVFHFDR